MKTLEAELAALRDKIGNTKALDYTAENLEGNIKVQINSSEPSVPQVEPRKDQLEKIFSAIAESQPLSNQQLSQVTGISKLTIEKWKPGKNTGRMNPERAAIYRAIEKRKDGWYLKNEETTSK